MLARADRMIASASIIAISRALTSFMTLRLASVPHPLLAVYFDTASVIS
jgi:hypothetical protein